MKTRPSDVIEQHESMKRLDKNMDSREFLQMILKKYPALAPCVNCPHHNGECVEFARQGQCKAYD